jgi:hypothetical protein
MSECKQKQAKEEEEKNIFSYIVVEFQILKKKVGDYPHDV